MPPSVSHREEKPEKWGPKSTQQWRASQLLRSKVALAAEKAEGKAAERSGAYIVNRLRRPRAKRWRGQCMGMCVARATKTQMPVGLYTGAP